MFRRARSEHLSLLGDGEHSYVATLIAFLSPPHMYNTPDIRLSTGRRRPITFKMQLVMWFAGLRGAIAFALALNVPSTNRPVVRDVCDLAWRQPWRVSNLPADCDHDHDRGHLHHTRLWGPHGDCVQNVGGFVLMC